MENLENEIWKDIIGYEGLYQISNLGRVKSLERKLKTIGINNFRNKKENFLKPHLSPKGEYLVNICDKKYNIKLLVANAFLAPPESHDSSIFYFDSDKKNNRADNLYWKSNKVENYQNEIWKDIIGYEGYYQISNFGRIKKMERMVYDQKGNYLRKDPERLNKIHINKKRGNYYTTDLHLLGKRKTFQTHRLLAIAFIPNTENKKYVNHIDHNPMNNSLDNLEWVNQMENSCHAQKKIKRTSKYIGVGWDKYHSKWKSQIYFKGKSIHIGSFKTEQEAYEARKKFEQDNGISNKYL